MKIKKHLVLLFLVLLAFASCNKDDGGSSSVSERDRTEQQLADKDSLMIYFETHYYNSAELAEPGDHTIYDIEINELPTDENGDYLDMPDPESNTMLIDALLDGTIETHTTTYQDTEYEYYVLRLNQGGGEDMPYFSNDVRVNYEGSLVSDDEVFDSTVNPTDFDLLNLIQGWREVLPQFNTAASYASNGDGTYSYTDYGFGVMFIPSGLGYFSSTTTGVSAYSCLVFKFELYQTAINDHDLDGIPTHIEDLDGDKNAYSDDTDDDDIPNFLDTDDDGDGVLTIDELIPTTYTVNTNIGETEPVLAENEYERSRSESDGIITINTVTVADSNDDGIPDYLDENITINYNEDEED